MGRVTSRLFASLGGIGIGPRRAASRLGDFLSVAKPFSYAELLARVRAVLRRTSVRSGRGALRVGELTLDPVTRAVRVGGEPVVLSAKEFALLHQLAEDPERVYTKRELLRDVWGFLAMGNTRTLDAHACRLRKKLGARGGRPWVLNVRGVGYRLTEVR